MSLMNNHDSLGTKYKLDNQISNQQAHTDFVNSIQNVVVVVVVIFFSLFLSFFSTFSFNTLTNDTLLPKWQNPNLLIDYFYMIRNHINFGPDFSINFYYALQWKFYVLVFFLLLLILLSAQNGLGGQLTYFPAFINNSLELNTVVVVAAGGYPFTT